MNDSSFMQHALMLARRGLGTTAPNPSVGCVIVKDGKIIGRGWTQPGGVPHAEIVALAGAGADAKNATMYVTLEPCNHHGKTPPCADAIIASGVKRIVVACRDSNKTASGGIEKLRAAGIEVEVGVCEKDARKANEGFFSVIEKHRPFVSVKIAVSADNKMTNPKQRWITGERAREYVHLLRAQHDAIATGIGTVLADDPELTCRLPELENYSPKRFVFDSKSRTPKTAKILPATIIENGKDLSAVMKNLAEQGITRLMVEAGTALSGAFISAGLADRIYRFRAEVVVGGGGLVGPEIPGHYRQMEVGSFGEDILEILEPTATNT